MLHLQLMPHCCEGWCFYIVRVIQYTQHIYTPITITSTAVKVYEQSAEEVAVMGHGPGGSYEALKEKQHWQVRVVTWNVMRQAERESDEWEVSHRLWPLQWTGEVSSGQLDVIETEMGLKLGHSPAVSQTGLLIGSWFQKINTVTCSTLNVQVWRERFFWCVSHFYHRLWRITVIDSHNCVVTFAIRHNFTYFWYGTVFKWLAWAPLFQLAVILKLPSIFLYRQWLKCM